MTYCTSIGYDTGIFNTTRGISQDIPLCPRSRFTIPPDHDVLILNTNVDRPDPIVFMFLTVSVEGNTSGHFNGTMIFWNYFSDLFIMKR
jgi:hypothetical protein